MSEMAVNGQKGRKWLEMARIAGNGLKQLEMAGHWEDNNDDHDTQQFAWDWILFQQPLY